MKCSQGTASVNDIKLSQHSLFINHKREKVPNVDRPVTHHLNHVIQPNHLCTSWCDIIIYKINHVIHILAKKCLTWMEVWGTKHKNWWMWNALTTGLDSTKLDNMMKTEQRWGTSLKTTKIKTVKCNAWSLNGPGLQERKKKKIVLLDRSG